MQFDVRTLLFAAVLINAVCAGARFLLWRMHPGIPGVSRWAIAGLVGALAFLFVMLYGYHHRTPYLNIAQLLIMFGLILSWDGFRRFLRRRPPSPVVVAIIVIVFMTWLVYAHSTQSTLVRAQANALLVAIFSALIARELLFSNQPGRAAIRASGWIFAFNSVIFFARIALPQNALSIPHDALNPSGVSAFIVLWSLSMSIAVTLGMFLMTAERLQAELDSQANLDPLTGAHNRRAFTLISDKLIARAQRYSKPLSVLIMDLDHFKQVNDQLGHEKGDAILCRFVDNAKRILRGEDVFCRFGGEEFVAMLPDTTSRQAFIAAERLRNAFEIETAHSGTASISVSIGIAELIPNEDIEGLLRRADSALYLAKHQGRNRCEIAEADQPAISEGNSTLDTPEAAG